MAPVEERRLVDAPSLDPQPTGKRDPNAHDPYAALRAPDYRLFAGGFIFSSTGLQMLSTALGWEIYQRTHDVFALGLIGLVRAVPVILLALPAGHAIDLYNRKRLLVATQAAFAVLAAALAIASFLGASLLWTYGLVSLMGCVRTFNGPTRQSLLPLIVPGALFHNAVTWNSGVFHFSALAGPVLAGLVIRWTGAAWPVYALATVGLLIFTLFGAAIRFKAPPRVQTPFTPRAMLAGLDHLWHEKTILAAIALDLFAVLFGGATALLPVYAADILHVGPVGLGALRAAPFVGALVMALALAHRPPFRKAGRALLWSVAGFGLATVAFGLSRWFPVSLAALMVLGALDNISVVIRHVLVQVRTPDALRGRVAAVNSVFIESSNELGAFESGAVASLFSGGAHGSIVSVVSGGIGTVLVVLGVARAWPQVRRLGRLEPPKTD
jgi:MFS family permease